ncbi:hypothetical protein C2S53_009680 [Perilla frutescens var. hirtella]|uniref:Disease resistance N-terminal domain-containing protein n=1 Tax=Perilla frutescens var. hirtella TaxID=608512 RepID=A0AAD4J084_PERFH|nr:hypothetical protein C2S53_009680 [Perilla frutescens var. hirtella]
MAEAFLKVMIDKLSSLIQEEIRLIMGVNSEMKKLSSILTTVEAVLEDAEDKQIESKPIRDWLRKLNCLAYEIDDIFDECEVMYPDSTTLRANSVATASAKSCIDTRLVGG